MSTSTPHVGDRVTFDGSASACAPGDSCGYNWAWFFQSADGTTTFTGGQMGLTPTVTYVFDTFAASKPFVTVVFTVSHGRTGPRSSTSSTFTVLP